MEISPNGRRLRALTPSGNNADTPVGSSPDNRFLVIERSFDPLLRPIQTNLVILPRDGRNAQTIAEDVRPGTAAWSPR